jgi:hypothetical protein
LTELSGSCYFKDILYADTEVSIDVVEQHIQQGHLRLEQIDQTFLVECIDLIIDPRVAINVVNVSGAIVRTNKTIKLRDLSEFFASENLPRLHGLRIQFVLQN